MSHRFTIQMTLAALMFAACTNAPDTPIEEIVGPDADRTGVWIEFGDFEFTEQATFPEALEGYETVEVLTDRLIFDFGGASPLEVGQVVAGGGMADGYIRTILEARTLEDGRQEVVTRQAGLNELFTNYEIDVRGRPAEVPDVDSSGDALVGRSQQALTQRFAWRECIGENFSWNSSSNLPGGRCGDSNCDASEDVTTCVQDCGPGAQACGNAVCDAGETEASCFRDCDDGIPDWAEATAPPATAPTACGGAPTPTNTCTTDGQVIAQVCPYLDWTPNFDWGIRPIQASLNVDTTITAGVTATAGARVHAHCSADFVRMLGLPDRWNLANMSKNWVIGCIPIGTSCLPVYFGIEALVFAEPILQGDMDFRFDTGEVVANAQMLAQVKAGASVGLGGLTHSFNPRVVPSASFQNSRAGGMRIETGVRAGVVLRLAVGVKVSVGVPPLPTIPAALLEQAAGVQIPTSVSIGAGAYVQVEIIGHLNSVFENDFSGCGWRAQVPYCLEGNIAAGAYVTTPIPGVGVNISGKWNLFKVEGVAYSNSEEYEQCQQMNRCEAAGGASCHDMIFGTQVCENEPGYQPCAGDAPAGMRMAERCTCSPNGFVECGACTAIASPAM